MEEELKKELRVMGAEKEQMEEGFEGGIEGYGSGEGANGRGI